MKEKTSKKYDEAVKIRRRKEKRKVVQERKAEREAPADKVQARKRHIYWEKDIIELGSNEETQFEEELEELKEPKLSDGEAQLGKRGIPAGDLFTIEEREYLDYVLDMCLQNRTLTCEEETKLFDVGYRHSPGYVQRILAYEQKVAEYRTLYDIPVYYKDLQGGKDLETDPKDRKRFMPLTIRDWSKQAYDQAVREEEHRNFLFESSPWMKVRSKLDIETWKKNISAARLAKTQKDTPIGDRKALTEVQKKANYRAGKKGMAAEEWKRQKEEKKLKRPERKAEQQRSRREKKKSAQHQQDTVIGQQE